MRNYVTSQIWKTLNNANLNPSMKVKPDSFWKLSDVADWGAAGKEKRPIKTQVVFCCVIEYTLSLFHAGAW